MHAVSNIGLYLAQAAQPAPGGAGFMVQMMPMILIFVVMYLLLIRPQQQKAKEHREMVSRLKVGDAVVTTGGMHGKITGVKELTVILAIADKVEVEIVRSAIGTVLSDAVEKN